MGSVDDVIVVLCLVEIEGLDVFFCVLFEFEEAGLDFVDDHFTFVIEVFLAEDFFGVRGFGDGGVVVFGFEVLDESVESAEVFDVDADEMINACR